MIQNRHIYFLRLSFFLVAGCAAHYPAMAAKEDVSRHDPPRWYQGADTPRLHHENLVREAHAAHAQALRECRPLKKTKARAACREEARVHLRSDLARARRIFKAAAARGR